MFAGISFAAILGAVAYHQAGVYGSRSTLIEWVLGTAFLIGLLLAIRLDLWTELQRGSNLPTILVVAVVVMAGLALLAGELLRWTSKWNLSAARVGVIVFLDSYLLFYIVFFSLRLKEQS